MKETTGQKICLTSMICVILAMLVSRQWASTAQEMSYETFISNDATFSFDYPADWKLALGDRQITLTSVEMDRLPFLNDGIGIVISIPTSRDEFVVNALGSTPLEIVSTSLATMGNIESHLSLLSTPTSDSLDSVEEIHIIEMTVNNRPAARGRTHLKVLEVVVDTEFIALEVSDDMMVIVSVTTPEGVLDQYDEVIQHIIESIRYSPSDVIPTDDSELNKTYTGAIDLPQSGTVTFSYPEDWFVTGIGVLYVQNSTDFINLYKLTTGQLQIAIIGPEFTMTIYSETTRGASDISSITVVQAQAESIAEISGETRVTFTAPESIMLKDKPAAYYRIFDPDRGREVLYLAVEVDVHVVFTVVAFAPIGEMSANEDTILDIVASIEYVPTEN